MAETAAAPAPKAAKPKKATKPKAPAAHPTYLVMSSAAISALKDRTGSSRQAILKYIMANYKLGSDSKPVNARLKVALKNGIKSGALKQLKGTGASGSFKVAEKPKAAKKVAKKAKSPKKAAKKPAAKKAKSPKKAAKKPAAKKAKTPKKAKSPKKAAKPKKPAAAKKSPKKAAKKPAAKKAAKK